jgi:cytolysin-activating lysine-acyltransferase
MDDIADAFSTAATAYPSGKASRTPSPEASAAMERMLGGVVLLMTRSKSHRRFTLSDVEAQILPPLVLRQARVLKAKNGLAGFVSWAFVSPEVEMQLVSRWPRLIPPDWRSGEQAWIIDLVGPPKAAAALLDSVRRGPLSSRTVKFRRTRDGGDVVVLKALATGPAEEIQ